MTPAGGLAARSPKFTQFYDFLEKREQFNIALFFYGSDGKFENNGNNGSLGRLKNLGSLGTSFKLNSLCSNWVFRV